MFGAAATAAAVNAWKHKQYEMLGQVNLSKSHKTINLISYLGQQVSAAWNGIDLPAV